ncbi:MAG: hypothetical protein QM706_09860 [Nitrospira sp.]
MTHMNHSNRLLRTTIIDNSRFLEISPPNASRQAEDFKSKVTEQIAEMLCNELPLDAPKDFDGMDLHGHISSEPDDSQLLRVEPPLTLSKIFSKLTAVERLWLTGIVKSHGKELMLARWPAYEVHINYVRHLR